MNKKEKIILIIKIIFLVLGSIIVFYFTKEYLKNKKESESHVINIYEISAHDIIDLTNSYLNGEYTKNDVIYIIVNTYNSTCSNTLITISYSKDLCNELYSLISLIKNDVNYNNKELMIETINKINTMIK